MKILMYGWEFPPLISGGLGIACKGIVTALSKTAHITFVLPEIPNRLEPIPNVTFIDSLTLAFANQQSFSQSSFSILKPYATAETAYQYHLSSLSLDNQITPFKKNYPMNLMAAAKQYGLIAGSLGKTIPHDIIHAHDWLTILAGIEAKKFSEKPLVFHVHSLETDRSGDHLNEVVYAIEKQGMIEADRIMAVSQHTKNMIIQHYGISSHKINVVHNGIDHANSSSTKQQKQTDEKMVIFVGRITHQKGPLLFIEIAQKILSKRQDVHFVVVGNGDMMKAMVERAAYLQIGSKIHFTGFLKTSEINQLLSMADVYVMTSISEPFGLSCLEAILQGVPAVISKQSGVSEVMPHLLKADFWDIDEMASKILSLLHYPVLHQVLTQSAVEGVKRISWDKTANKISEIYSEIGVV